MSLFSAMRSGVSGMSAQSSRLAAISDNISNSATVGYKRAAVDFSTLVTGSGSTTTYSAGGVQSNVHYQVQKDGTIQGTQSSTDMAIGGRGFFVIANKSTAADGAPTFGLTRAGSFLPDDEGYLRNSAGQYLQGWKLNPDGSLPAVSKSSFDSLTTVKVGNLAYGGSRTTAMTFSGNLPAQAANGSTFDTTSGFYDGLGNTRDLKLTWTKTANPNEWSLNGTATGGYTVAGLPTTVTFGATGPSAGLPTGALPTITVTSPDGVDTIKVGMENLTQFNGDYVPKLVGDGAKAGKVTTVEIDKTGKLWAIYDNGARQSLYQVPVADVVNPDGLKVQDGNTYTLGSDSGALSLSAGNSGSVGAVEGYALEQSNVDIAEELVSLIETQRAYSSNATIVRTTDEMVEETTRLKR
ncbi:flagellar hook protein FlgE [Azospirillum thermophilum]|uniref:Flagellar hook protein FlgE n=1 Tax=Azospirillum thermophilum TaxID=2202148 RepID=A0A2S2CUV0_9PROT|nr:flagellar hook protein FlgE [Azospirillum thermophilum]AWK88249.1 flagellar hook protein FlgE [Azospirillum thermophilum]